MRNSRYRSLSILLLAAACVMRPAPARAQTADDLFSGATLQTVHVTMHSRDWESLRDHFTSNDFYPADVTWNGQRVRNVGIRSRGLGSRSGIKPGLELDFARYNSHGRFLGLPSLVLDNLTTDPSMIRERVAMAFLRRMGVAAPREAHGLLFVNGAFVGIYGLVEPIDLSFVQRTSGDAGGLLFEYHWLQPFYATYPGDNLDVYRPMFESRSPRLTSTFELYDPIRELFRAINESTADAFRAEVGMRLDLESTLRLIACEAFLAEWDGVLGYAGMNNFYLYRDETSGQMRLFPWDADHALYAPDYPLLAGANENVLMRRVLEDDGLRSTFLSFAAQAVQSALADDWLAKEIAFESQQLREAALADPLKPYSNEELDVALAELATFARTRPGFVARQIDLLK